MMDKAIRTSQSEGSQSRPTSQKPCRSTSSRRFVIVFAIGLAYLLWWYRDIILPDAKDVLDHGLNSNNDVDWNTIKPSENLQWAPCLDEFLCARLTVPMDYARPLKMSKNHPKVHIALMMFPGINHTTSGKFSASPLLLNPGGPGSSGVRMIRTWGNRARKMTSDDQDVIGFDPRGIGESTPQVDCFSFPSHEAPDQENVSQGAFNRMTWEAAGLNTGIINLKSDDALINLDDRTKSLAKLCNLKDALHGGNSILRHINTMNVVKDMLSIIDAWSVWTSSGHAPKAVTIDDEVVDQPIKLKYWGFSYGTLLGSTFAAVYPERVGRIVLDGILNANDYVNYSWTSHTKHIDAVLASFFQYCSLAGESCHLYRLNDSASDIEVRFHNLMEKVNQNAITLTYPKTMMPAVITFADVKDYLFQAMFRPMETFPRLAQLLNAIDRKDDDFIATEIKPDPSLDSIGVCNKQKLTFDITEAGRAVSCSDKRYPFNASITDLKDIYRDFSKTSYFADVWMSQMIGCRHWNISAMGPSIPFQPRPKTIKDEPITTSFPLLFVSTSEDPVGPIRGGLDMALRFRDAGFIEQRSEGHCSSSVLSQCTVNKVRSYFRDGIVPPPPVLGKTLPEGRWDRCERDEWPWKPFEKDQWKKDKIAIQNEGETIADRSEYGAESVEEEATLLQTWKEMQRDIGQWKLFAR